MTGIGDKGDLKNERVGFRVVSDCDLKNFIVFRTTFNDAGFYNKSNAAYWFAPEIVKMGDRVVICTTSGQDSFQANEDGSKTYFRYWGLDTPIFIDQKNGVVLANVTNWSTSTAL